MCGPCCNVGKDDISLTANETYTPDDNIVINEPLRPDEVHDPDDVRPEGKRMLLSNSRVYYKKNMLIFKKHMRWSIKINKVLKQLFFVSIL